MRFSLSSDHKEFFIRNGYIEFDEMLSLDLIESLKKNAEGLISSRLKLQGNSLAKASSLDLLLAGYDLWRGNEILKKIAHKKGLAALASELFHAPFLRSAFDQYLCNPKTLDSFFAKAMTLQECSCLNPLAGGVLLPFEDVLIPFSSISLSVPKGSGLFISPSIAIDWPKLLSQPDLSLFLIGFAEKKVLFQPDTRDPRAVLLKHLGYIFNEFLNDSLHPVLLRKGVS